MAKLVYSQVMKSGSGEGSRGGKVIGHTQSGKPIYETTGRWHGDYTKQDHKDAIALHNRYYKKFARVGNSNDAQQHLWKIEYHKESIHGIENQEIADAQLARERGK